MVSVSLLLLFPCSCSRSFLLVFQRFIILFVVFLGDKLDRIER